MKRYIAASRLARGRDARGQRLFGSWVVMPGDEQLLRWIHSIIEGRLDDLACDKPIDRATAVAIANQIAELPDRLWRRYAFDSWEILGGKTIFDIIAASSEYVIDRVRQWMTFLRTSGGYGID